MGVRNANTTIKIPISVGTIIYYKSPRGDIRKGKISKVVITMNGAEDKRLPFILHIRYFTNHIRDNGNIISYENEERDVKNMYSSLEEVLDTIRQDYIDKSHKV